VPNGRRWTTLRLLFITAFPSSEDRQAILSRQQVIVSTPVELAFADHMQWDIDAFTENCAKWISDPEMTGIARLEQCLRRNSKI
jgi:hypothetical protein